MESDGTKIMPTMQDDGINSILNGENEREDQSQSLATPPAPSRLKSSGGSSPRDQEMIEGAQITAKIQEHVLETQPRDVVDCGKSIAEPATTSSTTDISSRAQRVDLELPSARYHLPSPAEFKRSTELIGNWMKEITKYDKEISSTRARHYAAQRQFDNIWDKKERDLSDALDRLRQERRDTREAIREQNQQEIKVIRTSLLAVENRMDIEQAFIAGIRKLSVGVLAEVFRWYVGDSRVASRKLALVCKEWRRVALDTPYLWATLRAFPVDKQDVEVESNRLRRRIELSRSTLLNVYLSTTGYKKKLEGTLDTLFHLLSGTGVERWKSLRISSNGRVVPSNYLDGLFQGNYKSIQTLKLCHDSGDYRAFASICRQISLSRPIIVNVDIEVSLPEEFHGKELFQHVTELRALATSIPDMLPLPALQVLWVRNSKWKTLDAAQLPILPETTTFSVLSTFELSNLQLHAVQSLTITSEWTESESEVIIELPNLHSLDLPPGSLSAIKCLSAPNLHILKVKDYLSNYGIERVLGKSSKDAMSLFQDAPHLVLMRPTTFETNLALMPDAWFLILQTWPQIQHLTLRLGLLPWESIFVDGLDRKKKPLCPSLISLKIELATARVRSNGDDLKQIIMKMQGGRKGTFRSARWKRESKSSPMWEDISTLTEWSWPSDR